MIHVNNYGLDLLLAALWVGAVSITLTRSQITRWIRESLLDAPWLVGELVNCPYCVAHWLALGVAIGMSNSIVEAIVYAGVILALASIYMGAVMRLWHLQEGEIENMRDLLRDARDAIDRDTHSG